MQQMSKVLGVFSLAMITAVSVDSIRNLPATALFGSSLIFFFIFASLFFLLPCALISAHLASKVPGQGVYSWVKAAFGPRTAFLAIWLQWIENVIWYPTILSFVAATMSYLIAPSLADNKFFLIIVILVSFWGATWVNWRGIKSSAKFSNFCALVGLIVPMALIIAMGILWFVSGKPLQVHFQANNLWPNWHDSQMWVALTSIILSFCGMEIAAVHSSNMRNPQKDFPKAMLIATLLIVITLLCGSLAIAIVLPQKQISLVAGIMEAFQAFFGAYHVQWILPLIAAMLVIGGMGGVSNWIIAPTRGLLIAAQDNQILPFIQKQNRFGAPSNLLLYQAIIVSLISLIFLLMPSVNGSYWFLTALAAQLYMGMYLLMFAAAIRLRYKKAGFWGILIIAAMGIIGSLVTLIIGFVPPANVNVGGTMHYELMLFVSIFVMLLPPLLIHRFLKSGTEKTTVAI
jgi:amino acid transporter